MMTLFPLWSITTSSWRPLLSRSFPAPPPSEARVGPDAHGGRRCGARSDPQPGFGRRIGRRSSESVAQPGRHLGQVQGVVVAEHPRSQRMSPPTASPRHSLTSIPLPSTSAGPRSEYATYATGP